MKQKLSFKEYIYVASMLFGMFFGAGNLIFPVYMGQVAGRNMWAAVLGFLITGVGLPLLGVAALGISRSNGLFDLSHKVGRPYAFFFTCALYLTIGPFFAIPRCATTSFTVGLEQILPHDDKSWLYLLLFSLLFFAVTFGPFSAAGQDPYLCRQGPDSLLPGVPGDYGVRDDPASHHQHRRGGASRCLCRAALLHRLSGGL